MQALEIENYYTFIVKCILGNFQLTFINILISLKEKVTPESLPF